jgi:hypothetical protein
MYLVALYLINYSAHINSFFVAMVKRTVCLKSGGELSIA